MAEQPLTVLVVEDHEFQRRIAARLVRACGATTVLEAADGCAALRVIEDASDPIDLIVCDLQMPGMDGVELLRAIAERRLVSSVIVASSLELSVIRSAEAMARSYGVTVIGAIEKPLTHDKLQPLILRHLGRRSAPPRAPLAQFPEAEIRAGLTSGQFLPFFQPKVDMRTRALAGVEALIRWQHPTRGLVPPGAFIAVMEASELIDIATEAMLDAAISQSRRWRDDGLELPVSINVSASALADTGLADRIAARTQRHGVDNKAVIVEITESAAMTDVARSLDTLTRLRMKGFGLSIDDYGMGFSSMQQLARIPFTEMKIDQTFVMNAADQPNLEAMLDTSLALARRLNLKSVAEGVETSRDWDLLVRLGCDVAQGYLIAKPMPGEALQAWYAQWVGPGGGAALKVLGAGSG
jgi:EAL domain-containing protein (putative c-di-GMP-specific phosphodiesterase class I)/CheY-like chemotaxis protein